MWLLATLCAVLLAGCSAGESADGPVARPSPAASVPAPTATTDPTAPTASRRPSPTAPSTGGAPARPQPVSLPALFARSYDGRGLRPGPVLVRTDAYEQRFVTYRSGRPRISGVLNVPRARGPFPALVLAHGYIDPGYYANGQGLRREQDWLARAGYIVLHTDYRGHAASDDDPTAERRLRLGYTVDTVNAVHALRRWDARRSGRPLVDEDRTGLLGRSMGGGVVYNALVAQPGLVDAAVVYAPVSSRAADNFNRWIRDDPGRSRLSDLILDRYGEPGENPAFWRGVSPRTYFGRITEPVLIHHGTADESCPIRWSRASLRALRRAGVDARLRVYRGEPHAFIAAWPASMRRTVAFFRANLR
jgi:dipeptidyl aminopeptidase/acylaminoacyl peptidase